jgi:hypothetical protein
MHLDLAKLSSALGSGKSKEIYPVGMGKPELE